jgi:hypothetical protein
MDFDAHKLSTFTGTWRKSFSMKVYRIIIIILLLVACTKENNDFKSSGTITGVDYRMCACCGGWFINIDNAIYLFDSLPKDSNIDLASETFPLDVKLDWQLISNSCSGFSRISVLRIKKI